MTATTESPDDLAEGFSELLTELTLLAEAVLERAEPVLRRAAMDGPEWSSCHWCPVCAAAALVRGEHHAVLTALAEHGTAIITVLREALAGVPVDPVMPDDPAATPSTCPHHTSTPPKTPHGPTQADATAQDHRPSSAESPTQYVDIPVTIH